MHPHQWQWFFKRSMGTHKTYSSKCSPNGMTWDWVGQGKVRRKSLLTNGRFEVMSLKSWIADSLSWLKTG
jgi:hypothetical protein